MIKEVEGIEMSIKEKYESWLEHANEEIKEELDSYSEKEIEDSFNEKCDLYIVSFDNIEI